MTVLLCSWLKTNIQEGAVTKHCPSRKKKGMLVVQINVDDNVLGGISQLLVVEFVKTMTSEFEISMVSMLSMVLGLQVNQTKEGITISQSTYTSKLVERFGICSTKTA